MLEFIMEKQIGLNLTTSANAVEAIVTGITGGYFANLVVGALEMVTRAFKRK